MDVAPAGEATATPVRASSGCRPASCALVGARYVERPGTDGPLVDYWVYEDLYAVAEARGDRRGAARVTR